MDDFIYKSIEGSNGGCGMSFSTELDQPLTLHYQFCRHNSYHQSAITHLFLIGRFVKQGRQVNMRLVALTLNPDSADILKSPMPIDFRCPFVAGTETNHALLGRCGLESPMHHHVACALTLIFWVSVKA